jgi:hypothetical protein
MKSLRITTFFSNWPMRSTRWEACSSSASLKCGSVTMTVPEAACKLARAQKKISK